MAEAGDGGVEDGGEEDGEESEEEIQEHDESGLATLRTLNDGECSVDWYNFQESMVHLQALEEDVVEAHRSMLDGMERWRQQDVELLALANQVDYDQDGQLMHSK